MPVDWLMTTGLYADLLCDPDIEVSVESASLALQEDVEAGRVSAMQAMSIALNASDIARNRASEDH
jgi:hypothetical protein